MQETSMPGEKELRMFLRQIRRMDQRPNQGYSMMEDDAIGQLKCVEAKCISENLDTSDQAKGQAAAEIIKEIILNLEHGSYADQLLACLLVEHCIKGRKIEIVGQELGYSRSQSYRLRTKGIALIQSKLADRELAHISEDQCPLQSVTLLEIGDLSGTPKNRQCQFSNR